MTDAPRHNDPQTNSDPFLEEVHRLKREAIARSGDDLDAHFERLRQIEAESTAPIIQPKDDPQTGRA